MRTLRFEREPVDFDAVADPKKVGRLEIAYCSLQTLDGIHRLGGLTEVHIYYCRSLTDLCQLEGLRRLRQIDVYCLPNTKVQFRPDAFPKLERLSYNSVAGLVTIRGIERLKYLSYLGLSRVTVSDGDYMPIVRCASLRRVFWHGAPFKSPARNEIRRLRPDILIGGNNARPSATKP